MRDLLDDCIALSRKVGKFLVETQAGLSKEDIEFKGAAHNLVSRADREAEQQFVHGLQRLLPEAGFIAEEGTSTRRGERYNWIIDPLDGTTNYLYNIPCFCTSLALQDGEDLILGVIYDPVHEECFYASAETTSMCNDTAISVSRCSNPAEALVATGFPYDRDQHSSHYLQILHRVNSQTRGIRRLGSAALDLAYVACGRFDAFYEYGLQPWDCAAGALIITQAGGKVNDFGGGTDFLRKRSLMSSNGHLQAGLLQLVKDWPA